MSNSSVAPFVKWAGGKTSAYYADKRKECLKNIMITMSRL